MVATETETPARRDRGPRSPTQVDASIGHNLKTLRLLAGLSQQDVARRLGVTFQQVQKYERGVNRLPLGTLLKLAALFDVPLEPFFAGLKLPGQQRGKSLPRWDDETVKLCGRLAALDDAGLRRRIGQVVEILLS